MRPETGDSRARGEYVEFLDSDDLIAPTKFERQVAALRERPECGVAYCVTLRRRLTGAEVVAARTGERFDRILPEFLTCRGWHTITPLWRRTVCEAIGAWGPFRVMEDWEYDCRAGILGVRPVYCPEPLATVRDHSGDRAGRSGTGLDAEMLRGYFAAHRSIYERLQQAALTGGDYMRPFSRRLFRIARLCGARGLKVEAREALELALEAARPYGLTLELRMFRAAARLIGWQMASRLSEGAAICSAEAGEKMPIVSVVMSVFNGERDLRQTVETILGQSFRDFEFIIVNDGSQDSSREILAEYERTDGRVLVIEQDNCGITRALIHGLRGGPRAIYRA